jgi:hypothetical protein
MSAGLSWLQTANGVGTNGDGAKPLVPFVVLGRRAFNSRTQQGVKESKRLL